MFSFLNFIDKYLLLLYTIIVKFLTTYGGIMSCEHDALIQIYKLNKYVEEITSKACHQLKINHLELMIIGLSSIAKMNVSKLSQELRVSKSAISQAIVCLQIKRLITRQQVEDNKKSFIIIPTKKAIQVCEEIFKAHHEKTMLLKEEIGEEKYQMFFSTIRQINKILNEKEIE